MTPSLSPELVLNILQSLDSPQDLYSIIAASSHFYRGFASYRQSTTAAILRRAVTPQIEGDFLSAYRAQKIWRSVPEGNDDLYCPKGVFDLDRLRKKTAAIFEESTTSSPDNLNALISDSNALPKVWMFYRKFDHLILKYATSALQELSSTFTVSQLSTAEKTRLKRAFFRCEIYTCLFQFSQLARESRTPVPFTDPAPTYIRTLPSWEIEQVHCVLQYYMTTVEHICDRMEDEFISLSKARQLAYRPSKSERAWKAELGLRRQHNEYIVSRGMLALWKLTHIPYVAARKAIVNTHQVGTRQACIVSDLERQPGRRSSEEIADSDGNNTNFGWRWVWGGTKFYPSPYQVPANSLLRDQGYVFWDQTRLEGIPPFSAPRAREGDLDKLPPGYRDHANSPGVEARLADFEVNVHVVGMIADDIMNETMIQTMTET
ncbi:hypothetical protein BJY00DRAFT_305751 [Aspergillus carlsbadensis]|nr:hypothetical protein BJY00DRAFT_305751 [Aspergillus carlsbadensis]